MLVVMQKSSGGHFVVKPTSLSEKQKARGPMLKIYTSLDAVPEGLRGEYKLVDGRYIPDLSDDHPVLVHNKTLLSEKSQATARVKEVEADLEEAKKTSIPRGHMAVAKADAELLDKYKVLGKVEDVTAKLTEHTSLSEKVAKQDRETSLRAVARELNYNADAFVQLSNLPDFEIREKDGKKTVIAKVKEGETVVEKPASEFVEASYAVFLPSLKAETGVTVHGSSSTDVNPGDPFKWAKDWSKDYIDESKPVADPFAAFNQRQSA